MKKIIAIYYPQFHTIPENSKWWGEGFTDWTNVKKAEPLFDGHYQPRIPLNENYYDLSNVDNIRWQVKLAKEYGIYGFCFYHYWFNGRLLLQKPMELFLNDKSLELPFCISWANETWARTWDGHEKDILIKQEYSGEKDWKTHFEYLKKFFKDERYIKINNKPVLILYTAFKIEKCDEMVEYWNIKCIECGFDGIYIIETLNGSQKKEALVNSDAVMFFEPNYTIHQDIKSNLLKKIYSWYKRRIPKEKYLRYDIKNIYSRIEKRKYKGKKKCYKGTFVDWDNTSRKKNKALIVDNASPEIFEEHFGKLIGSTDGNDVIFINAWNEWAEGAYLEPDVRNGYGYLNAIKNNNNRMVE